MQEGDALPEARDIAQQVRREALQCGISVATARLVTHRFQHGECGVRGEVGEFVFGEAIDDRGELLHVVSVPSVGRGGDSGSPIW